MAKASAFAVNDTTMFGIPLCPGQNSVEYLGNTLVAGDVAFFHFNGSSGIDSVVKVVVFVSPVLDFWATTSPICKGSKVGVIDFWGPRGHRRSLRFFVGWGPDLLRRVHLHRFACRQL